MPFDFFKKKKKERDDRPAYDVTNLQVTDIRVGFTFDYDLKTWVVKDEYEYDWGNFNFSYEYRIVSDDDEAFLSVDNDDGVTLTLSRKIRAGRLGREIFERIEDKGAPPREITYEGTKFYRENERPGFFRNTAKQSREESDEFISWEYYDDTEAHILVIEQWDEDEFEASIGILIEESEISNLLPGENS
ncbi:MAG: DUF4178 domain-containing protein [Bernardetiaceae bacterium]